MNDPTRRLSDTIELIDLRHENTTLSDELESLRQRVKEYGQENIRLKLAALKFKTDCASCAAWHEMPATMCDELRTARESLATLRSALTTTSEGNARLIVQRDELLDELRNFVAAKRFSREHFDSQLEFADWLVSRARHVITNATTKELK